jgi:hypothetical protein
MARRFYDRVQETSTTTGAGDFTLAGASTQCQTIASRFAVNDRFRYFILLQGGTEWESGCGYLSGSTTLVRELVSESSNADAAVTFSAGTKTVAVGLISDDMNDFEDWILALQTSATYPTGAL